MKTPPSSPPLKQKVLEKGKGSNSSSTDFSVNSLVSSQAHRSCHDKSYSSSPSKANNQSSGGDSQEIERAALQKIRERERKTPPIDLRSNVQYRGGSLRSFQSVGKDLSGESRQNALRVGIEDVNKKLVNVPSGTGVMYPLGAIGEYRIVQFPRKKPCCSTRARKRRI